MLQTDSIKPKKQQKKGIQQSVPVPGSNKPKKKQNKRNSTMLELSSLDDFNFRSNQEVKAERVLRLIYPGRSQQNSQLSSPTSQHPSQPVFGVLAPYPRTYTRSNQEVRLRGDSAESALEDLYNAPEANALSRMTFLARMPFICVQHCRTCM